MSPKELLYIEDALGHITQLKAECASFKEKVEDSELQNFIETIKAKSESCFSEFYSLLA